MNAASPATTKAGFEEGGIQAEDHTVNDEAMFWLSRETDFHVTIFMAGKSSVH